jgi:site-specific DNA-methyltransferase (adenine-specific)
MMILEGDCLDVLKTLDDESIDSIVTDPPYGLAFMAKRWDYDVPSVEIWQECLRVLKPGGYLLAFAGTRTQHRMCVRIEDAGFEIRDMIAWVYGSGFPKSHDVSKAIDRAAGAEREVIGESPYNARRPNPPISDRYAQAGHKANITAPATPEAQQWQGWGTALKPALEPITVARKPLIGTVADNVMRYGTGALNVDGCRVEGKIGVGYRTRGNGEVGSGGTYESGHRGDWNNANPHPESVRHNAAGRWPANLIHDGSDEVTGLFPHTTSGSRAAGVRNGMGFHGANGDGGPAINGSSGSAARFFYCAKASKRDRDEGLNLPARQYSHDGRTKPIENAYQRNNSTARNNHPTVKPTELMRYLCRLVTQPNGVVLDPFCGSGSTGKAAALEGFRFVGIEREPAYAEIARARIAHVAPEEVAPVKTSATVEKKDTNQLALF